MILVRVFAPESALSDFGIQSASKKDFDHGAVAQLGERLICIQEVAGSIPTSSTRLPLQKFQAAFWPDGSDSFGGFAGL